jgi:protein O-mannosyl-transferase
LQPSHGHFELFRSPGKRTFVLCLLIAAATLAVYAPVTRNNFVNFDDDTYIVFNPHVRSGLNWQTVKWSFTTFEQANWHPLTWLSHAMDCSIFGLNPQGPHMVGVLLHAACAVILFLLLESATRFTWRSLIVAMLFALHPVNVESVAWAAERKNVLSMFFFLLALYAYGWYARRPTVGRYTVLFALYGLALMSKPQVITFPLLLLLWDYWPLRRFGSHSGPGSFEHVTANPQFSVARLVAEKIPLFALSVASATVTFLAQRSGHAMRTWADYGFLNRIENAVIAYARYLEMAVWPVRLAVFYPHANSFATWQITGAIAVLLAITLVSAAQWRQRPYLFVGWLWFMVSMLPMIGLVQVGGQALADRYAYLPFIGLFLMIVWATAEWAGQRDLKPIWIGVATVAILATLGAVTYRQIGYWRDSPSLWLHALAVTEDNFVAHDNLAIFLAQRGREDEAVSHLRAALAIKPNDLLAMLNLGTYEHGRGNLSSAIERYRYVASHAADVDLRANAYANLGSAYRQVGDYENAKLCYQAALQLTPKRPLAIVGLGLVAEHEGNFAEAARQFSNAMKIQPTAVGYVLLARAFEQDSHPNEAEAARERATQFSSDLSAAEKEADGLLGVK